MSEDRVVLITGASSGFGKLTAELLSSRGFKVFGTSRRPPPSEGGIEMLQFDLASDTSARNCVAELLRRAGTIDILVNNAGQAFTGGLEETSLDEAKDYFDSNFFGHVRMASAVLPEMRRRRSGQIINMASIAGIFPVPFEGYYSIAKATLIAYTDVLRQEVKSLGIKVSLVEPGFFKTELGTDRRRAANSIGDYDEMRRRAVGVLLESFANGGDPKEVAETILKIIESPSPKLHYLVGKEKRNVSLSKVVPASIIESQLRKHWRLDG